MLLACILLAAAAAAWFVATDRLRPARPEFTAQIAGQTTADLTSGDAGRVRAAIAWPQAWELDPQIVSGLAGSALELDSGSFREVTPALATVRGTLGGTGYTFYLVPRSGRWLLFDGLADTVQPAFAAARAPQRPAPRARVGTTGWNCSDTGFYRDNADEDGELGGVPKAQLPTGTHPTPQLGSVQPVILTYGGTGNPAAVEALASAITEKLDSAVYFFDHTLVNDVWAGDTALAGCLAAYIDAVARGLGDPVVVALSTGGLAVRYANDMIIEDRRIDRSLAGIVTVNTPHLGSPFGGGWSTDAPDVLRRLGLGSWHAWPSPDRGSARCLAPRQPATDMVEDCADEPPYVRAVVHQIVGEISIRRSVLQWGEQADSIHGDGLVSTQSQSGYNVSGPPHRLSPEQTPPTVLDCGVTRADLLREVVGFGARATSAFTDAYLITPDPSALIDLSLDEVPLTALPVAAAAERAATCSHTNILTDPRTVQAVLDAVADLR